MKFPSELARQAAQISHDLRKARMTGHRIVLLCLLFLCPGPSSDAHAVLAAPGDQSGQDGHNRVTLSATLGQRLAELFASFGYDGAFVLATLRGDSIVRVNADRCSEAVIPASTFKIPHSCIALETGAVDGIHDTLLWDGRSYSIATWEQDQSMAQAFQRSCVWFYQETARRIGASRMQRYLDQMEYGNRSIDGGLDRFWLDGALRISPDEQIGLLRKLFTDSLPFRSSVMRDVRDLMALETAPTHTLYGKSGWGIVNGTHYGWLVGAIDYEGVTWLYATLLIATDVDTTRFPAIRHEITRTLLREAQLLP
jgi:beta-lactamase class D